MKIINIAPLPDHFVVLCFGNLQAEDDLISAEHQTALLQLMSGYHERLSSRLGYTIRTLRIESTTQ